MSESLPYSGDPKEIWEYQHLKKKLNLIHPTIFDHLDRLPEIPFAEALEIAGYLATSTCDSDNSTYVSFARWKLWQIPLDWLTAHLVEIVQSSAIDWDDDYQYSNLCAAVYHRPALLEMLIQLGLASKNPYIREEAVDNQELLPEGSRHYYEMALDYLQYLGLVDETGKEMK